MHVKGAVQGDDLDEKSLATIQGIVDAVFAQVDLDKVLFFCLSLSYFARMVQ